MPTVQIYHQGKLQEEKVFKNMCWLVWQDPDELTSLADMEKGKKGGGLFMSRVSRASVDPELVAVFADWELIIDGVLQPQQFYYSIKGINGKVIQLRYKQYDCFLDFT